MLVGKRPNRGSVVLEGGWWDGRDDPFFKQALDEVASVLRKNPRFDRECRSLLRLQMAYLLLWSSLERYASLKYHLGDKVVSKILGIGDDPCFAKSPKTHLKGERLGSVVYSAGNLERYTLDSSDPTNSLKYYYQVRSNAIHRGKAVTRDFDIIHSSLEELLAIFREMLNDSFRRSDQ